VIVSHDESEKGRKQHHRKHRGDLPAVDGKRISGPADTCSYHLRRAPDHTPGMACATRHAAAKSLRERTRASRGCGPQRRENQQRGNAYREQKI